jgi:hypothetical protein
MASKNEFKPRMSDEAVEAKTGKNWSRWFKHLDAAGAKKMTHQEIVAHLRDKHDVRSWWQQMVAVTYEQARGLRDVGEKPSGYEISVSRTIAAPVSKAFKPGPMTRRGSNGCRQISRCANQRPTKRFASRGTTEPISSPRFIPKTKARARLSPNTQS